MPSSARRPEYSRSTDYYDGVLGQNGFVVLSSGATDAGDEFYAIQALEDSTVTAVTTYGDDLSTSETIIAGGIVYGYFTSVTWASGKVLCYLKAPK